MSARDVVNGYFEALGRRDVDAAAEFLDPEVVEEITGVGMLRGPDEVRTFFAGLMKAAPDMEMTVDRTVREKDTVVVQFNGVQPTGGRIEMRGCDVLEVSESSGKIVRNTAYQDGMEMARTLGMMPPQDSPAEKAMIGAFNTATKVRLAVRDRFSS